MKRVNFSRAIPLAVSFLFFISILFLIQAPSLADIDCGLVPDSPLCGGELESTTLHKRFNLQSYTGQDNYVDFSYNRETGNLHWQAKTYLDCFSFKQAYAVPRVIAGSKRRVRFIREFLLPPSTSQLCGVGWNNLRKSTGSMFLPLSQIQQDDFPNMFESDDVFISQG